MLYFLITRETTIAIELPGCVRFENDCSKFKHQNISFYSIFGRESEGSFQYGNYRRETDDLRAVVQYFHGKEHTVTAIIGHSKGLYPCSFCRSQSIV